MLGKNTFFSIRNVLVLKKMYFCNVDKGSVFIVKSPMSAVLVVSRNSPIHSGFFLRSKAVSKKIFSRLFHRV